MLSAEALHERGVVHARAGRYRAARADLQRAAARTDDRDLLTLIKGLSAFMDAEHFDVEPSIAQLEALLAEGTDLRPETLAVLHSQLGLTRMRAGDGSAALPHLDAAIDGLSSDPPRLINTLFMRGGVYYDRHDGPRAYADYARAALLARDHGDPHLIAQTLHNQGAAALLLGSLVEALELMNTARPGMEEQSPVMLAIADRDHAEALLAAGLPDEAADLLRSCAATFGRHRLRQSQAEAELLLARTLADSDPATAVITARRAARRFRGRGSDQWAFRAQALAVSTQLAARRGNSSAVREAEALLSAADNADLASASDQIRLALELHHARQGRFVAPTPALPETAPITSLLAEAEVRVEVAVRSGADQAALDLARAGITRLRAWQGTTDSIELRSSLAMHGYRILEQAMLAAARSNDPATVLEWSERSRGVIGGVVPVRTPSPLDRHEAEIAALRGLLAAGQDDSEELRRLRDRIRRRQWARDRAPRVGVDIAGLPETIAALTAQEATLVSFVADVRDVQALVVSRGKARVVPVTSRSTIRATLAGLQAELDMTAVDLRPSLHEAVLHSLRSRLGDLTRHVWSPVEPHIDTDRLVITAPAALAAVPWNLLPPLRDRSITVPTSVTQWLRHAGIREPIAKVGFIAGPDVPRAQLEIEHAAKQWPGATVITGPDANTASVRALAGHTDLLHVSAHGRHSPGNPMFSGLQLLDGPWLGHDVAELTAVPSVVVLSACEVGRSTARWGEETVGLARTWLHAGVRCVIAAPCTVNDAATSDYLSAVHAGLAAGQPPSDALLSAGPDERAPFLAFGAGF